MKAYKGDFSREHEAWSILASQSHRLVESAFKAEALAHACNVMKRVKLAVLEIVDNLVRGGYEFADNQPPITEPVPGTAKTLEALWRRGVFVPISLQAWMLEVGAVNLCGNNPNWPRPTYASDDTDVRKVVCTDPLVFDNTPDYLEYLVDEQAQRDESDGPEPLTLDVAPDHLHKANISGGPPYSVYADRPQVEALLLDERHCTTFTEYVRRAISWQGFPGMDYLTPGILPITMGQYPSV